MPPTSIVTALVSGMFEAASKAFSSSTPNREVLVVLVAIIDVTSQIEAQDRREDSMRGVEDFQRNGRWLKGDRNRSSRRIVEAYGVM